MASGLRSRSIELIRQKDIKITSWLKMNAGKRREKIHEGRWISPDLWNQAA
jgi:hypothetical protein